MKIDGAGRVEAVRAYSAKQTEKNGQKEAASRFEGDTLEISAKGRKIQFYLESMEKLPDVRDGLVASLQKQIGEGVYCINSAKIALGIIEEKFA